MPVFSEEINQTLAAFRGGLAEKVGLLAPDIQKDWNVSMGFQAYNLEKPAKMLFPQLTPVRNITPRDGGSGKQAEFKAVTALNTAALNGWVPEKTAASIVTTATSDIITAYKSMALADTVSFESVWSGRTFMDIKALAVTNLLRATMIQEENNILFGQNNATASNQQAPGAVGAAPTPTLAASGTGSNFAASAYYAWETVITGMGESLPSAASATITPTAGQNLVVTPVFPADQPVFGFNIYVNTANNSAGAHKAVSTDLSGGTAISSATLNGLTWLTNGAPVTLAKVPSGAAPPTQDNSASQYAYNGLIPQIFGGVGATLSALNGTMTLAAIDALFVNLWNAGRGDPDMTLCNVQESVKLTNLTFGAGAPYFVVPDGGQQAGTAGFRASRLINKATGSDVPVKVHPTLPQGFMLFLSSKMPSWYVPSEIPAVWDLSLPQDYIEIDYPPTSAAPYWQVEVRCYGALRLYLPLIQGALYGISNN